MARKPSNNEIEFIEESLVDLQVQLDNIKTYLDTNPWVNIEDETKKQREFKFQATLYNQYTDWLEKFMELTGVIDFYNESNKEKEDKLRKGYKKNALMEKIIEGDLEVDGYNREEEDE